MKSKRLGDILISDGLLTQEQLEEALAQQKQTHERLGAVLIEYGYITEKELIDALRNQLGIDFIDLTKTTIDPSMSRYIPKALAQEYEIVPIQVVRDNLFIAMSDP